MSCWATLFRAEQSRAEQSRAEQSRAMRHIAALHYVALRLFPCVVVVVSVLQHLLKLYTGDIDQVKELQYSFA